MASHDTDAQVYFTEAEWSCMVTIEKSRITNMLRNYKYLLAQGIDAKPPDFILRCENRKKQELQVTHLCESKADIGQSPLSSSNWDTSHGQASYSNFWEECYDSVSPDSENFMKNLMKENEYWGNASTNCNENCSDFCQYCYIVKQLKFDDSENQSSNPVGGFMNTNHEVSPLKHSNSQSYNCCPCGCQSLDKTKLVAASQQHTSDLHCQECGQKFAKRKYLKNHMKRFALPDDSRPFKCFYCSHSFVHEKNRKFHERVHNNHKLIPCCHCSQSFDDLTSARIHIDEAHQNRVHMCNECGMSYSNSSHLLRHKREVRKGHSHQCCICGHRYSTAVALSRHELHHSRIKPFKCKICLKTFSSKTHLTKHLNSQNTEKRYECPSCKVKFLAHKSLRKHERIFNGNRPFKCMVCGHAYNTKPRLTIHMKVHYDEQNCMYTDQNYVNGLS